MSSSNHEAWTGGDAYEPFIGRWSRRVAEAFVGWLPVPAGASWVDVGCGTGALTESILASRAAPAASVLCVDRSPAYVAHARRRLGDSRTVFAVADALALPVAAESIDAVASGLVLNFVSHPARAVGEWVRAVRSGGIVATYLWDYAGAMEMLRHFWDAAVALDAGAEALDEGRRFPLCARAPLEQLWHESGLRDVGSRAIDVPTRFENFEDFWTPFLGGQGPAPGYLATLDSGQRDALRAALLARLPVSADGSIELTARAWAVKGVRDRSAS